VETVDENYDVSIIQVGKQPLEGDFVARLLAHSEVITCASPSYLDRNGRPKHPRELIEHDTMLPSHAREITFQHGAIQGDDEPPGESLTLTPGRPALSSVHGDTIYAAALAGMGISGLPSYVVETALRDGKLERVLPEWRVLTVRVYAGMPTRKYVPARTRAFIDFLVKSFGGREHDPWLQAAGCETPCGAVKPAQ
ncbi:MAG TPA: substrate binding domain-containing protein, partial [Rhizobacter sp.]|nr:substrate binding domain-containing protein [Rhizobacter sp.]